MDIKALIPFVVQGSLFLLVLAVGLRSRWEDLTYVFRKPKNLARALVAVNVVVPLAAVILGALFPLDWRTKAGLIIMAVSPLAPFATGKMLKASSDRSYDVGLYAALILAAVVIVPLTVAILNLFYERHAHVSVGAVAWFVIKSVLIPLGAGVAIASVWPRFAERAAPIAQLIAYILLLPVVVLILLKSGGAMMSLIGDGTVVVINLIILAALAAGHWLGASAAHPGHRVALAQAAATRHPGIAGLIAQGGTDHDPKVMTAVLLFLVISVLLTTIYAVLVKRQFRSKQPAQS